MKYVLIDWDNTVRKGFALFTWIDFLCKKNLVDTSILDDIHSYLQLEKRGIISHSDLSKKSGQIYADKLKGLTYLQLENSLKDYIPTDESYFFSFVPNLFQLFMQNNIDVIIVSGSPELIIKCYIRKFNISRVYALVTEEINGFFTGNVLQNFGYDKKRIVDDLYAEYGTCPLLSIGDSPSDLVMLQSATHGFWIEKDDRKIVDCQFKTFNPHSHKILNQIEDIVVNS